MSGWYGTPRQESRADDADFPLTDRVRGYWNRPQQARMSVEIDFIVERGRSTHTLRILQAGDSKLHAFHEHVDRFLSTVGSRASGIGNSHFFPLSSPKNNAHTSKPTTISAATSWTSSACLATKNAGQKAHWVYRPRLLEKNDGHVTASPLLIIENGNWGATSLSTVHAVLKSAFDVLLDAFGKFPEPGPRS